MFAKSVKGSDKNTTNSRNSTNKGKTTEKTIIRLAFDFKNLKSETSFYGSERMALYIAVIELLFRFLSNLFFN